ncbi:MAG: peptidase [Hyphomicrobiaceae bacterium]|nr:peptidase [Hyphomicrobiaceae bacterium]
MQCRFGRIIGAALAVSLLGGTAMAEPAAKDVIKTYGDIAEAMYADALTTGRKLQAAVDAFLANPTAETHAAAKDAWRAARVPYQQTEGFRFGNPIVDDWEGRVNSWPLDEGLIDYVAASYGETSDENPLYRGNVIANPRLKVGKKTIDASKISKPLLADKLQEAGGVEANVATGYHAIEFLLWGQDLNGTGPGAGARPHTDFDLKACTNGNCDRRRAYLKAATDLLVDDLAEMAANWTTKGAARKALAKKGDKGGLVTILTGIGSLSYGELAGERTKLGLILHDPEEEHDCFSDNTHNSHYYDVAGMVAIVNGAYTRVDGSVVSGPSVMDLARAKAPVEAGKLSAAMAETLARAAVIKSTADSGKMAYDQMIAANNKDGNAKVQALVDGLITQTRALETVVDKLGLKIEVEGSDSLDDPAKVQ